jgi:RNA polymerase sigma factor (sigma-70 family)
MKELESRVAAVRNGSTQAYAQIVKAFQDMAFGYAYSVLGDVHQAEDATQEAFVEAYCNLDKLRDPAAFAGWFRRIVHFRCNRLLRGRKRPTASLDESAEICTPEPGPQKRTADREMQDAVLRAVQSLSSPLRQATALFYINGYSHKQISDFLEVPVNTVKSRLNASRRQLNERTIDMVKKAFDQRKPGRDFTARIIEGVPRVGFFRGGNACPETFTFPSCLSACLRYMEVDLGIREVEAHGTKWLLNDTYVHLMGTSGEAFRLFWKPGWHLDNTGILSFSDDSMRFISQAFASIGFAYEILNKDKGPADEASFRERIVESVHAKGRPALAFGVIGPPECAIITGCDREAEVLFGWSFFQEQPEHTAGVEFEPCGYFRKRHWFTDTDAIILIGDQHQQPRPQDTYRNALAWAIELIRKPTIQFNGDRPNGLAAFEQWAQAIAREDDFPAEDTDTLRHHHMVHNSSVGMVAEGRWYATHFLRRAIECEPAWSEPLQEAIDCFDSEHQLMWKLWGLVGGFDMSDERVTAFADPAIRAQMVPIIREAHDADAKAANAIERALAT